MLFWGLDPASCGADPAALLGVLARSQSGYYVQQYIQNAPCPCCLLDHHRRCNPVLPLLLRSYWRRRACGVVYFLVTMQQHAWSDGASPFRSHHQAVQSTYSSSTEYTKTTLQHYRAAPLLSLGMDAAVVCIALHHQVNHASVAAVGAFIYMSSAICYTYKKSLAAGQSDKEYRVVLAAHPYPTPFYGVPFVRKMHTTDVPRTLFFFERVPLPNDKSSESSRRGRSFQRRPVRHRWLSC